MVYGMHFQGVIDIVSETFLFPTTLRVTEFVETVGFFKTVRQCSFDASSMFLAYRGFVDISFENVCCVGWLPYKSRTGKSLCIEERQVSGRERDCEVLSATECY